MSFLKCLFPCCFPSSENYIVPNKLAEIANKDKEAGNQASNQSNLPKGITPTLANTPQNPIREISRVLLPSSPTFNSNPNPIAKVGKVSYLLAELELNFDAKKFYGLIHALNNSQFSKPDTISIIFDRTFTTLAVTDSVNELFKNDPKSLIGGQVFSILPMDVFLPSDDMREKSKLFRTADHLNAMLGEKKYFFKTVSLTNQVHTFLANAKV